MSFLKYGLPLAISLIVVFTVEIENPFLDLSQRILQVYKDAEGAKTEDLMNAANTYLCELVKLRMRMTINHTGSVDLMMEVYLEGNPPFHLRNIPWDKFIKYLQWNDKQITAYEDVITDTRRVWRECLVELEKHKDPDVIL